MIKKFETIKLQLLENNEILWLTLNKPKANILNKIMMEELLYSLEAYKDNQNLKMVVFHGAGGNFSFGASIKEHMPENVEKMLKIFHNLARFIAKFPIPVVSLIEGQCLGAGFEIALCSHLVFATPNSIIACPEIKLGVFPPILASLGDHKLGNSLTLKLMLTGCNISIKEALICGFINEVFTNGKADIMLINWFKKNLQQLSAFSLRQSIKALHHNSKTIKCLKYNLNKIEKQYLEELMAGYDGKEGISSFIEKRNPIWHNC